MLVLVKESHRALFVSDLGMNEYNLGIRLEMPLAYAKAIAPAIAHYPHDDHDFTKVFLQLAYRAMRFSPQVAIDDYGLLLNISGCAHLFGGEADLLSALDNFFSSQGFYTTIAIADNPLLAKAHAYFSPRSIIDGPIKDCIKSLPIDALFIETATISALNDLGISTMGAMLALPRKMLAQRFGLDLLKQIDQLLGVIHRPPNYLEETPQFAYGEHFSSPIRTHEHLIEASKHLLIKALHHQSQHYFSPLRFILQLTDIFKEIVTVTIESSQPHNQLEVWLELLCLKTENLSINQGIDSLRLTVTHFSKVQSLQRNLSQKDDTPGGELCLMTDKLRSRLGNDAIFHLRITDKHIPEQAVTKDFSLMMKLTRQPYLPPRPLRLFKEPIPVSVIALLPDNPPAKIIWKQRAISVLLANGPERIESEWWTNTHESARDYFYIEDERGKRLWIYSMGEPKQWFIHGVFA